MNKAWYGAFIVAAIILQTTFLDFGSDIVTANLILVLVVVMAVREDKLLAAGCGGAAGLLLDCLFEPMIGFNTVSYFAAGYLVGKYKDEISSSNTLRLIGMTAVATICVKLFYVFFAAFVTWYIDAKQVFDAIFSIELVVNEVLAVAVYLLLKRLDREPELSFGEDM